MPEMTPDDIVLMNFQGKTYKGKEVKAMHRLQHAGGEAVTQFEYVDDTKYSENDAKQAKAFSRTPPAKVAQVVEEK